MGKRVALTVAIAGLLAPGLFIAITRAFDPPARRPALGADALPDFVLEDQEGRAVASDELRALPVVVSFFFTRCGTACPVSMAHLIRLQRAVPEEAVRFVSFSIDPANDDREARRVFAQRWAPSETRWHVLSPSEEELSRISRAFDSTPEGAAGLHTTSLFLLAPGGRLRAIWSVNTPIEQKMAAIHALTDTAPRIGWRAR